MSGATDITDERLDEMCERAESGDANPTDLEDDVKKLVGAVLELRSIIDGLHEYNRVQRNRNVDLAMENARLRSQVAS